MKSLQEKKQPGMSFGGMDSITAPRRVKKSQLREVAVDAFNFQRPALKKESPPSRPPLRTATSYLAPSTTAPSLDGESVFSKSVMGRESVTTIDESGVLKLLTVPKPPQRE